MCIEDFKQLYNFLRDFDGDLFEWLNKPWNGKDKQESLLRLFSNLSLIDKLKKYDLCRGNFNKCELKIVNNIKEHFYQDNGEVIKLKDNGDKSDLHGLIKSEKIILATTSKNLNKENVNDLDIRDISDLYQKKYKVNGYKLHLCLCIRDCERTKEMISRITECNEDLKEILCDKTTIIIDWKDLNEAYYQFKSIFKNISFEELINNNKKPAVFKLHQKLSIFKTMRFKKEKIPNILWGHIQRSGKSYIMAGTIIEDSKDKDKCNYLVMSMAKNETLSQYIQVFDCLQLKDFNVIHFDDRKKKYVFGDKNIIICSEQFLRYGVKKQKITKIKQLSSINYDIRFLDESHHGGTSKLAQETLKIYGKNSFTIQITATYYKPVKDYNIDRKYMILWDLEDIRFCKTINNKDNKEKLIIKHGNEMKELIKQYTTKNIIEEYSKYPNLHILIDELKEESIDIINEKTKDNNYGWSLDGCFLLQQYSKKNEETGKTDIVTIDKFQNDEKQLEIWFRIFGNKNDEFGIPDKKYPDKLVFMKRIETICKNPKTQSRFIGDTNEPMIIMAFLPIKDINNISKATKKLLEKKHPLFHPKKGDYIIKYINSEANGNKAKEQIEGGRQQAILNNKKGVLVLSGLQCNLGVTIHNCDIVLLLNSSNSFDMIYQMMFRCMTEGNNKKCGFVVDLNIHRSIKTVIEYSSLIKPNEHPRKAIKYLLKEKLININADHWMPGFGNKKSKINILSKNIYNMYSSQFTDALNSIFKRISFKEELFSKDDYVFLNTLFKQIKPSKETKVILENNTINNKTIQKGIESTKVNQELSGNKKKNTDKKELEELEELEEKVNPQDFLKPISILISLLTIHDDKKTSLEAMYELIQENPNKYNILINQTQIWWGKKIKKSDISSLIKIFINVLKKDKETTLFITIIKELFIKNINNPLELSKIMNIYLIPQELEKKSNAEVSTPFKLKEEMIDKIPIEFWKSKKKVLEPCVGKGGFTLNIINKFMIGLKDAIPNKKLRYKIIIQECLYFSDINPTNIFICNLLIDPYNEYELNYNEGNTLELDIKDKWGIHGFDAIIGNPPYESQNGTGDNKLYLDFTKYSINILNKKGILLFITPTTIIDYIIEMDKNRNYLDKFYNIEYIALNTPERYFKVNSTFTYFMLKKEKYRGNTIIEHYKGKDIITLKKGIKLPKIPSENNLNIINKICSTNNSYDINKCKFPNNTQRIRKEHIAKNIVSKNKTDKFKYKIYDTINKTNPNGKYYYYDKLDNDAGKKRIILSNKGYLLPFVSEVEDVTYSDNFSYILYETNLLKLMKSKIVDYLIYQFSKNGFDRINCIKMIKKVKLKNNIYESFNLTKEEIKIIETSI